MTNPDIRVEMYEVGLGAAMLMQFSDGAGGCVRVLADAGVHGGGRKPEHVHRKLSSSLTNFDNGATKKLDLIIGTHYDKDHLAGLVPIIEDTSIEIGQVWLPPVANDVDIRNSNRPVESHHLLVNQLYDSNDRKFLEQYLDELWNQLQTVTALRTTLMKESPQLHEKLYSLRLSEPQPSNQLDDDWGEVRFLQPLWDAERVLGSASGHADSAFTEHEPTDSEELVPWHPIHWRGLIPTGPRWHREQARYLAEDTERAAIAVLNLAGIEKSKAKDAISAASLARVVDALKTRKLRPTCEIIGDGRPKHYSWNEMQRKFVPSGRLSAKDIGLSLLGPSEGLVKKHRDKLPIGDYMNLALMRSLHSGSITESNQLSYILRLTAFEQGILVSGDAGCVDFAVKPRSKTMHQQLLDNLLPTEVLQVAHHGGNNAYFYEALRKAGYAAQPGRSFLLLSHEVHDPDRPSIHFARFIGEMRNDDNDLKVLFTCKPKPEYVVDYQDLVELPTGGEPAEKGDILLDFAAGKWNLVRHLSS